MIMFRARQESVHFSKFNFIVNLTIEVNRLLSGIVWNRVPSHPANGVVPNRFVIGIVNLMLSFC
jgi:hypothetical protein